GDVAGTARAERGRRAEARAPRPRQRRNVLVPVDVGDVTGSDRDAGFLHVGQVGERLRRVDVAETWEAWDVVQEGAVDLAAVEVHQVAGGVGDLEPVVRQVRRARAELRGDVPVPEQALEVVVAAGLVGQQVGRGGGTGRGLAELDPFRVRAERAA